MEETQGAMLVQAQAVHWISGLLAWGAECGPSPSSEVLAKAWEEAGPPLWSRLALRINS